MHLLCIHFPVLFAKPLEHFKPPSLLVLLSLSSHREVTDVGASLPVETVLLDVVEPIAVADVDVSDVVEPVAVVDVGVDVSDVVEPVAVVDVGNDTTSVVAVIPLSTHRTLFPVLTQAYPALFSHLMLNVICNLLCLLAGKHTRS